jgi:N-acetylneuraminic acid mutarotase
MLVWGGVLDGTPLNTGAVYDVEHDTWKKVSEIGAAEPREDHVAIWTGKEMIVWGGNGFSEENDKISTGGRYNPELGRWTALPSLQLTARDDARGVWTGSEMLVWGGRDDNGHTNDGARYHPTTNTVRAMSDDQAPAAREDHTAIWTGSEMIIWGGWNGIDNDRNYNIGGGRYDPKSNRWRKISNVGAPEPREDQLAVWTGSEMIVWGGMRHEKPESRTVKTNMANPLASNEGPSKRATTQLSDLATIPHPRIRQMVTGARYSPSTDSWTPMSDVGAPDGRDDAVMVWTGHEVLIWGGQSRDRNDEEISLADGSMYIPSSNLWCSLPALPEIESRKDHVAVWTGSKMLIWGGTHDQNHAKRAEKQRSKMQGSQNSQAGWSYRL